MHSQILLNNGFPVRILELEAKGINGIRGKTAIHFNPCINVIWGIEGLDKTAVLRILENAFFDSKRIRKNIFCSAGDYKITCSSLNGKMEIIHNRITGSAPYSYGPNQPLHIKSGISNWFIKRTLFADKDEDVTGNQRLNYHLARECFSLLDPELSFQGIKSGTGDVIIKTPGGSVPFDYLSRGYQNCICQIHNIIKGAEQAGRNEDICVRDFRGCILVEEIEEGISPSLQIQLLAALRKIFPKTQLIISSSSPYILQSLYSDEIILVVKDRKGGVQYR